MKPADVKSSIYINSSKKINDKDSKFKVGDIVGISKYRNIFPKALFQISLKNILWLKKLKILCRGHMLLVILTEKKFLERFTKKDCTKQIKKSLELKRQ